MEGLARVASHPVVAAAVVGLSTLLLLSFGGAIVAAPLTLPALLLVGRAARAGWVRVAVLLVAGLTAAEVSWAVAYVTVGEASPLIWALPAAVGVGTVAGFFLARGDGRPPRLRLPHP